MANKDYGNKTEVNPEIVLKELCKFFSVNYAQFANIWTEKQIWQRRLWNQTDILGWNQRLCRDVTNMILSEPVRIWTANDNVNALIETEIKGRLHFDSIFSKNLQHCMGIGDMLLTVYMDALDNQPAINYVPGYNIIPISFNNHAVTELAWFTSTKVGDQTFVIATLEKLDGRSIHLFEYSSESLLMINYGTPLWTRVLGNIKPAYDYDEVTPIKKFDWISTGLNNARWIDTPFHNSFIWPIKYIDTIIHDWRLLEEEYANSKKRIFISPELVKRTFDVTDCNGTPIPIKKFNPKESLFECVDMAEEQIKEWVPNVRFNEFVAKIKFDLQCWGTIVGLGTEMYDFDKAGRVETTATQVILSHRDAFNTINDIKKNLTSALQTVVFALIDYWFQMKMITPEDYMEIGHAGNVNIHFDDGVFVNKAAKLQEGLNLYSQVAPDGSHLISRWHLLTHYGDYSDEEAAAIIQESEEELLQGLQLQMAMMQSMPQEENKEAKPDAKSKK